MDRDVRPLSFWKFTNAHLPTQSGREVARLHRYQHVGSFRGLAGYHLVHKNHDRGARISNRSITCTLDLSTFSSQSIVTIPLRHRSWLFKDRQPL